MAITLESRLIPFALKGTDEKVHRPEDYPDAKVLGAPGTREAVSFPLSI